jgi:signal peptidase I
MAYPVILLTASAAMVISRVLKLGQENAIQARVVPSTSLQETLEQDTC